jgi:mannose-6-phosphate isomerase-like protein (cupin superfamily)
MKKIETEWGYNIVWAENDKYEAKFVHINPNSRLNYVYHKKKHKTYYVMAGEVILEPSNLEKNNVLGPGSIIKIEPNMPYSLSTKSSSAMLCEANSAEKDDDFEFQPGTD